MKITIIPSDNAVYVDGVARIIDGLGKSTNVKIFLADFVDPELIHAVQFDGTKSEVEYTDLRRPKQLVGLTPLTQLKEEWDKKEPDVDPVPI